MESERETHKRMGQGWVAKNYEKARWSFRRQVRDSWKRNGGDDEARVRDLCRNRRCVNRFYNNLQNTRGLPDAAQVTDNDCLDGTRRFIDEGEHVHHVKNERRQRRRGSAKEILNPARLG